MAISKNGKVIGAVALVVVAIGAIAYSSNAATSNKDFANFESVDKNGDSVLDRSEFSNFLKSYAAPSTGKVAGCEGKGGGCSGGGCEGKAGGCSGGGCEGGAGGCEGKAGGCSGGGCGGHGGATPEAPAPEAPAASPAE